MGESSFVALEMSKKALRIFPSSECSTSIGRKRDKQSTRSAAHLLNQFVQNPETKMLLSFKSSMNQTLRKMRLELLQLSQLEVFDPMQLLHIELLDKQNTEQL
jgi:hypothetical protein